MKKILVVLITAVLVNFVACNPNKKEIDKKQATIDSLKSALKQDSINDYRNSQNFEEFLSYFLYTCFWGKNIDSLIYVSSPIIKPFIHDNIGFGRYYNPGATTNFTVEKGYGYYFNGNNFGTKDPVINYQNYFKEKTPDEGYNEESSSKDGIYYKTITKFPDYWDQEKIKSVQVNLPQKYRSSPKMKVIIQNNKWVIKTMYFVKVDDIWWLVFFDDCSGA